MKNELSDCYYRLSDISSDLRKLTDTESYNGNDLETYIERHEMLKKLVNKYGSIENSIQKREEFRNNFNDNNASEKEIQALKNQLMIMQKELIENASNLSKERRSIADYLSEKINTELNQLGFKNVVFSIDFKTSEKTVYTENGMDNIEFMIGPVFLGLDSGSTTTKAVLTDCDGRILWRFYDVNAGNPRRQIGRASCRERV